jgi:uncharacterized protein YegJ (DUF2314 family)
MVNIKKNIEKNFIWRDPLDSEEAKAMAIEETVPHNDIKESNIVYSCPKHGKETYFSIKKLEQMRKMRDYVYVWFKHRNRSEKMWVRITSGSRLKGQGTLDNEPTILTHLKLKDIVKFKTDVEGITWGR